MKKAILILSVLTIILQLNGCSPSKPTEELRVISADRLIKKLEANRRKIKTFTGSGSLSINSSSISGRSSFEVIIKKPDSIKVSFFGPFGIDLAQTIITQNDFIFYDIINNVAYKGRVTKDAMKQLLKIDLPFDDVLNALTGSVNLTNQLRVEPDIYEVEGSNYKLTYKDSVNAIDNIFRVRINDQAITKYLVQNKNKTMFEGSYSDFKTFEEVPVPFKTIIEDFENKQSMRIEYRNAEVNEIVEDLRVEIPNDAKVIEW